jgi:hypothetical protein
MRPLLALLLIGWAHVSVAEVEAEKFKVAVGGYLVAHQSTQIFTTADSFPLGFNIDYQDDLGMDTKAQSFRLDSHYRFNPKHKIEFSYYRIHTDATTVSRQELIFGDGDYVFSAGAKIESYLNMDIFKLNYAYSFYHSEQVELSAGIGLHTIKTTSGLTGEATLNGDEVGTAKEAINFLAPLPVLGFRMAYNATEKFEIIGSADYFGLNINNFSGYFTDIRIAGEYSIFDNFGIGAGLNFTVLDLQVDKGYKVKISQGVSGVLAYLSYRY